MAFVGRRGIFIKPLSFAAVFRFDSAFELLQSILRLLFGIISRALHVQLILLLGVGQHFLLERATLKISVH